MEMEGLQGKLILVLKENYDNIINRATWIKQSFQTIEMQLNAMSKHMED